MTTGYCYVLINSGLPGHCKIGRTIREVKMRAAELWKEYGTLEPFVETSRHLVSDCVAVETMVHRKLKHLRVARSELFRCSVKLAQSTVLWAAKMILNRSWLSRVLHSLILPRPERAPKRWRRARHLSPGGYGLSALAGAVLLIWGLNHYQPDIPEWLPEPVGRTALRIESWGVSLRY